MFKHAQELPRHLVFLTIVFGIGAVFHIPFVMFDLLQATPVFFNRATVLSILFVVIFPTLLAVMFFNYGIEKIGPSKTSAYFYLIPVVTALLAYVFLGEAIAAFHVIGAILIISGVFITTRH